MAELIKIYWRDIPSQVMAKKGRKAERVMLSARFQEGIDRAAMRAGKGTSDAYMEDWKRLREPCEGDLKAAAEAAAEEIEAAFSDDYLETLVKAKGLVENLKSE